MTSAASDLHSTSGSTSGSNVSEPSVLSKQIETELEKHLRKSSRTTIDAQEKRSLATRLGIKPNDIDRWLSTRANNNNKSTLTN